MALIVGNRTAYPDYTFTEDEIETKHSTSYFQRLSAKERRFVGVDFKYCIFEACYLRSCTFDSCDFTGCRFIGCNFHGSSFTGCKFRYSYFERTYIDAEILKTNAPSGDNLKQRFARTLRMNFQSLGDSESVNLAINLELKATREHLNKSWHSSEPYYLGKYPGLLNRVFQFIKWFRFVFLDLLWGNGESLMKLSRSVLFFLLFLTINNVVLFNDFNSLKDYLNSFTLMLSVFFGARSTFHYTDFFVSTIAFVRLISISLFISIIVKRFNRR